MKNIIGGYKTLSYNVVLQQMSFLCVEILMVYLSSFELCKSLLLKPFIILRYSFFRFQTF